MEKQSLYVILLLAASCFCMAEDVYQNDAAIVELLNGLEPGKSINLPKVKHVVEGKEVEVRGYDKPYSRDYTNKMAYAPDRKTALYCGGNHGAGRTNDVWEFHLGSNTWHCLFKADGGDHAKYKSILMYAAQKWNKHGLEYELDEKQKKQLEETKIWWEKNVDFKDGHYVTKRGGTLLHGHTWDTLVYDEGSKKLIQGNGAHCADSPFLMAKLTNMPLDEVKKTYGVNPQGVPYRPMWMFDPIEKKWIHHAHENPLAELRGMGASLCYIPDWKKTICYASAQNVYPQEHSMKIYDGINNTWEELFPNGGKKISELSIKMKVAPESEPQLRYSSKHKKIIAVLKRKTFCYDLVKNEWSDLNAETPFHANDVHTVFDYDQHADVFLLIAPRKGDFAFFDIKTNQWKTIEINGDVLRKPPYNVGMGYYDPIFNVFVVQSAGSQWMWVYRHAK